MPLVLTGKASRSKKKIDAVPMDIDVPAPKKQSGMPLHSQGLEPCANTYENGRQENSDDKSNKPGDVVKHIETTLFLYFSPQKEDICSSTTG